LPDLVADSPLLISIQSVKLGAKVISKLLRSIVGRNEQTDWESVLTQAGESSVWADDEHARGQGIQRLISAPDPNLPDTNLALLGLAGVEVHSRARLIAKELHAMAERGATVQQWNLLIHDVTSLGEMGQMINSLAEIKLRQVQPKVERISMMSLMGSILAKRANDMRRSGVLLVPRLQSCAIEGDANLCRALVESSIEWALPFGNRLTVTTELSSWADAARLTVLADHVVRTQEQSPELERTSLFLWELICELAQAAGVVVNRTQVDGKTAICIEFPVHNDNDGNIASPELRLHSMQAPQLAQMDVVVFASSPGVKMSIDKALSKAECRARYAASLMHLVRECELSLPKAAVVESELLDENVLNLIVDLRRHVRNFAFIEIVREPNVYDVSLPGSKNPCRLSAANIESNLRDALLFELAQA
jgi:hypothetical protein